MMRPWVFSWPSRDAVVSCELPQSQQKKKYIGRARLRRSERGATLSGQGDKGQRQGQGPRQLEEVDRMPRIVERESRAEVDRPLVVRHATPEPDERERNLFKKKKKVSCTHRAQYCVHSLVPSVFWKSARSRRLEKQVKCSDTCRHGNFGNK